MGPFENRLRATMLPGGRKGRTRPPAPAPGVEHMRDRFRSASTTGPITISAVRRGVDRRSTEAGCLLDDNGGSGSPQFCLFFAIPGHDPFGWGRVLFDFMLWVAV